MTHPGKRHAFCMAAVLAISASVASLSRTEMQAAWNIGDPIVTYWAGPGYDTAFPLTDAAAKQMVDLGMNLVWTGSAAELQVAQRHGLRALYVDRSLLLPASLDDPARRVILNALINSIRHNPALYAYHIIDEPGATLFADLARIVDYLRQRDPAHMAYIDLFPNYASDAAYGTKGYGAYLDTFVSTVKPSLLSYDHYQFRTETDSSGYLQNLAEVRQKAKAAGIPFMNIVQAASWDRGGVRIPTDHQERVLGLHHAGLRRPGNFVLRLVLARSSGRDCAAGRQADVDLQRIEDDQPRVCGNRQAMPVPQIARSLLEGLPF